jgi:hypothetical protein
MEPIRPVGPPDRSAPPVPAIRPLTRQEREEAARDRRRKRRERDGPQGRPSGDDDAPTGGSVDVRA